MLKLNKPKFWQSFNFFSLLLTPLAIVYRVVSTVKYHLSKPKAVSIPVICVGNVVLGGTGKTPIVIAIAKYLSSQGRTPAIITRGYRGSLSNSLIPLQIKPHHTPFEVGDESLMLSEIAPTYICTNRYLSAKLAMKNGAEVVIMDDGLQNYSLKKDFSLIVIDQAYGLGNSRLLPAGPLREPLSQVFKKADCIILTGEGQFEIKTSLPQFKTELRVLNEAKIEGEKFIAMCGIGSPEKFIRTLESLNITILEQFIFEDHHHYTYKELDTIYKLAENLNVKVITTAKDRVKIPEKYLSQTEIVEIEYILPPSFYNLLIGSCFQK
jgi:tetraacyldisaccharide 4'-kinase